MTDTFDKAFALVIDHEGGFDNTRSDRGNWTSGIVGVGSLNGTKYGVSAAAYPDLDIANLTLDQAQDIFRRDYWNPIAGDSLPPMLALLVFDAAVNNGVRTASRWLQSVVGAFVDGVIGPETLASLSETVSASSATNVAAKFHGARIYFMGSLSTWRTFGRGWAERLAELPFQSLAMMEA